MDTKGGQSFPEKNRKKIIGDNAGIIKDDLGHHEIVLPPLLAFLTTSRVLFDSPMPQVLLQADQSVQCPTLQLTGPPNKNNSNSNFYHLEYQYLLSHLLCFLGCLR